MTKILPAYDAIILTEDEIPPTYIHGARVLTVDEWIDKYKIVFEFGRSGPDNEYGLPEDDIPTNRIWTDYGDYFLSGFHTNNVRGYLISEIPWTEPTVVGRDEYVCYCDGGCVFD
jgi:hypothetical protein